MFDEQSYYFPKVLCPNVIVYAINLVIIRGEFSSIFTCVLFEIMFTTDINYKILDTDSCFDDVLEKHLFY